MKGCTNTPLVDLLRDVPITHRTEWEIQWAEDGTPTGHAMCPIGKHCHEAADRIEELEAQVDRVKKVNRFTCDNDVCFEDDPDGDLVSYGDVLKALNGEGS